jgi:dephospho-CoA kinase
MARLSVVVVYLAVQPHLRLERIAARDNLSSDEIAMLESHSTERGVASQVKAQADIVVVADGGVNDTLESVLQALNQIPVEKWSG